MRFLALDYEAGSIHNPGPVTLGLAIFQDGEVESSHEWLFKPIRKWNGELMFEYTDEAAKIHGQTVPMMDDNGLDVQQIYSEVLDFLGKPWSSPIVSHNAPYDGSVWSNMMFALSSYDRVKRLSIPKQEILTGPWICTKRIAQSFLQVPQHVQNLKLDTLCKYYGIGEQGDVHGAEADAILAGRLYLAMKGKKQEAA